MEEVTLWLTSSPFVQDRLFKTRLVNASLVRASLDKASFSQAKSRLQSAPELPQAQGLSPVADEVEAGGKAVMWGGHETPVRRGRSPPDPMGRVTGVGVQVTNDYPKDKPHAPSPPRPGWGRLLVFAAPWISVTSDRWVLEVVAQAIASSSQLASYPFGKSL